MRCHVAHLERGDARPAAPTKRRASARRRRAGRLRAIPSEPSPQRAGHAVSRGSKESTHSPANPPGPQGRARAGCPSWGTWIVPPLLRFAARIYGVVIRYTQQRACTSSKARHASLSASPTTHTFILPYFCSLALPAFCLLQPCPIACHTLAIGCVAALTAFRATPCWERDINHAKRPGDIVQITWRAQRANSAQGTARNHALCR